jgi:aminoglycoside phosphotransferase (APT) family kinase protein
MGARSHPGDRLANRHRRVGICPWCHGDAHVWNSLHSPDGDVRVVDWDDWRLAAPTDDLAYMMALHWYPERRHRLEDALLCLSRGAGREHDRSAPAWSVEPLDRYFREQAGQDARRRVAAPIVLRAGASMAVLGYYTLSALSVDVGARTPEVGKKLTQVSRGVDDAPGPPCGGRTLAWEGHGRTSADGCSAPGA